MRDLVVCISEALFCVSRSISSTRQEHSGVQSAGDLPKEKELWRYGWELPRSRGLSQRLSPVRLSYLHGLLCIRRSDGWVFSCKMHVVFRKSGREAVEAEPRIARRRHVTRVDASTGKLLSYNTLRRWYRLHYSDRRPLRVLWPQKRYRITSLTGRNQI